MPLSTLLPNAAPDACATIAASRQPRGLRLLAGLAATALIASSALAAPPAPMLAVSRSIEVAAPADKVWAVIGDFGDLGYFSDAVAQTEIVHGENNRAGAQRRIVMRDGGVILETLIARREKSRSLSYRMDQGGLPVSDYRSTLSVKPAGAGSRVTWRGSFRGKLDAGAPDRTSSGKSPVEVVAGIYEGGLSAIKHAAER